MELAVGLILGATVAVLKFCCAQYEIAFRMYQGQIAMSTKGMYCAAVRG